MVGLDDFEVHFYHAITFCLDGFQSILGRGSKDPDHNKLERKESLFRQTDRYKEPFLPGFLHIVLCEDVFAYSNSNNNASTAHEDSQI